jgi:hypothetical protein
MNTPRRHVGRAPGIAHKLAASTCADEILEAKESIKSRVRLAQIGVVRQRAVRRKQEGSSR